MWLWETIKMAEMAPRPTAEVIRQDTVNLIRSARRYYGHALILIHKNGYSFRTIETFERPPLPKFMEKGSIYFKTSIPTAFRPDKIASRQLGDPALWWWILLSNGLFDCSQIKPGMTLQVSRPPAETPRFNLSGPA